MVPAFGMSPRKIVGPTQSLLERYRLMIVIDATPGPLLPVLI
jgi:hypothetical protein